MGIVSLIWYLILIFILYGIDDVLIFICISYKRMDRYYFNVFIFFIVCFKYIFLSN